MKRKIGKSSEPNLNVQPRKLHLFSDPNRLKLWRASEVVANQNVNIVKNPVALLFTMLNLDYQTSNSLSSKGSRGKQKKNLMFFLEIWEFTALSILGPFNGRV